MFNLINSITRLTLRPVTNLQLLSRNISSTSILSFKTTNILCAEPLKKKKKMDPAIVKAREDRRRRKIEKQIRRLEKNARQLKPIDELEVPLEIHDQLKKRQRKPENVSAEILLQQSLLQKEWAQYKREEYISDVAQIDRIMSAQKRALDRLYEVSEELYSEAIMPDLQLIPYSISGPLATPPIKKYESPDGEYIDISKKWND